MVASALLHEGVGVFARVEAELRGIMASKGYSAVADFQGDLGRSGEIWGDRPGATWRV